MNKVLNFRILQLQTMKNKIQSVIANNERTSQQYKPKRVIFASSQARNYYQSLKDHKSPRYQQNLLSDVRKQILRMNSCKKNKSVSIQKDFQRTFGTIQPQSKAKYRQSQENINRKHSQRYGVFGSPVSKPTKSQAKVIKIQLNPQSLPQFKFPQIKNHHIEKQSQFCPQPIDQFFHIRPQQVLIGIPFVQLRQQTKSKKNKVCINTHCAINQTPLKDKEQQCKKQENKKNQQMHFLQTYYKYKDFRERAYNLIPAFKPTNDYLKRILKNAKRAKKNAIKQSPYPYPDYRPYQAYQRAQQIQDYLEQKIILQRSHLKIIKQQHNYQSLAQKDEIKLNHQSLNKERQTQFGGTIRQRTETTERKSMKYMKTSSPTKSKTKFSTIQQPAATTRTQSELTIYHTKIRSYRQFLFQMNLAHLKFDKLFLMEKEKDIKAEFGRYKIYVGRGNNSNLVRSLIKRRFWWTIVDDYKKANFVWTQLKINAFYQFLKKSQINNSFSKLQLPQKMQPSSPKKTKKKSTIEQINKKPHPKGGVFKAPLPQGSDKIFTQSDKIHYENFLIETSNQQEKMSMFSNRLKHFPLGLLTLIDSKKEQKMKFRIHNHLENNFFIGNKKALFYNLKQYYQLLNKNVFTIIPMTFHIRKGMADPQYQKFLSEFKNIKESGLVTDEIQSACQQTVPQCNNPNKKFKKSKNVWIVKPGQLSNRGNGITVIDQVYQLNSIIKKKQKHSNGLQKTYIVQKYIEKPFLYNRRKFDIRHYMMASRLHGLFRVYWFAEGYIRTSSTQYDLQQIDNELMHLTNDAIQKQSNGYGKYEQGNKVSYNQFQRYLDHNFAQKNYSFAQHVYPKMKNIALDAWKATYLKMDPHKFQHTFEIFGLDFMIDSRFDVFLIEVNTNPCLQLSSNLLSRVIPTMLEHSFRLTLDVVFPPPAHYPNSLKYLAPDNALQRLQCQLIFDEARDGKQIQELYRNVKIVDCGDIDQEQQTFENDGKELALDVQVQ